MHTRDAHARKRHSHLYLGNFASNHGKRLISSILHRLQRSARQNSHHLVRITTHLFRIRHRQRKKIIQHRRIRRRVRWIHPTRRHAQAHFVRQHHPSAPTTPHSPRNHVASCTTSPPRTISAVSHRTMGTVFGEQSNPTITCRVVPDCNRRLHSHASPHAHPSPHAPSHEHRAHGHVARAPSAAEHSIVVLFVIARRVPFNAQASRAGVAE